MHVTVQHAQASAIHHMSDALQARVYVPDERFNWLTELYKPKSSVAAFLDIVDIAGLVKCALSAYMLLTACAGQLSVCCLDWCSAVQRTSSCMRTHPYRSAASRCSAALSR